MKCLLALSVLTDYHSRSTDSSLTDLETLTGLSRPMVMRGLKKIEALGLIEVDKSHYVNRYTFLIRDGDDKWAKVPVVKMRSALRGIDNRGIAPFVGLKLYLTLLSLRYGQDTIVTVAHDTLRDYTRVQPKQIRKGLDVLYSHGLVHLQPRDEKTSNQYQLIGL
ncbi:replication protein (plasmid) [Vibrio coralliilyticus]|nr:replication protein [Vibrio coralliilyticus]